MTTPFGSQAFPENPTMPATVPLGYVTPTAIAPPTSEPPLTEAQIAARRDNFYELMFQKFLLSVTGLFVPGDSSFTQLQAWASDIPILGDLAEIMTGVEDGDLHDIGTWANNLLGNHKPVPQIQAAAVVDSNPNRILEPNFSNLATIVTDPDHGWSWVNSAGRDGLGCAQVVVASFTDELLSNEINVSKNQKLELSVWVKWSGLSYAGTNPIALGVTRYLNYKEVGSEDVAFIASPLANSDWVQLTKSAYVVPDQTDELRLRFKVDQEATSGTIFWDDASVTMTQPGSGYVGSLVDTAVNGLENVNQPGWDLTDLLISMLKMFRTTSDHAARITFLENLNSPFNKINDEFLRVGPTLGDNWNQTYIGFGAGTWETDGDYAVWRDNGVDTLDVRCRYIGDPSTTVTDNQKIVAVLGAKGEVGYIPFSFGLVFICESHVDLYGRMNVTETDWIRARFSASGDVFIHRSVAGVITQLGHAENFELILNPNGVKAPGAGSTITLLCGTDGGTRSFAAQIDGVTVLTATDTTSSLGPSFRGYGHGVRAEGSILVLGQATPASLNAWAAVDN